MQRTLTSHRRLVALLMLPALLFVGCLDPCGSCLSTSRPVPTPVFETQGSMMQARFSHTATLLSNDKVLVAGGASNLAINNSAELYDPGAGEFVSTGPMNQARVFHTATLLPDGQVLMAGGHAGIVLDIAELYNPQSKTFALTANTMTAPRTAHTATLLGPMGPEAGMVLIAGGSGVLSNPFLLEQGALNTAELYDPVADTFTQTSGKMNRVGRSGHTATLLADGRVLLAGGMSDTNTILATAEIYDPSTGMFTHTSSMQAGRRNHAAILISGCACPLDGQVFISGGRGSGNTPLQTAELFDPATRKFTPGGKMKRARFFQSATAFGNGDVLLAGGDANEDSEIYHPGSRTFQLLNNSANSEDPTGAANGAALLPSGQILVTGGGSPPSPRFGFLDANTTATTISSGGAVSVVGPMSIPRAGHTATPLPDGTVLETGGETPENGTVLSSTELYDPTTKTFSPGPDLAQRRFEHTATALSAGAQVLIVGGANGIDPHLMSLDSAELYDTASNSLVSTGSMSTARDGATASLISGCLCGLDGMVLVAGGTTNPNKGNIVGLHSAEVYNPATGSFTSVVNMVDGRAFQSAAVLNSGTVLLVGGIDANGRPQKTAELFDPVSEAFTETEAPKYSYVNVPAITLADGNVLLNDGNGHAELYELTTMSFVMTGSPIYSSTDFTASLLNNRKVLFTGGFDLTFGRLGTTATELYDPDTKAFVALASGRLNEPRGAHTATVLAGPPSDGAVLITGGEAGQKNAATLSSAELIPFRATLHHGARLVLEGAPTNSDRKTANQNGALALTTAESAPERVQLEEAITQHRLALRKLPSPEH